MTKKKKPSVDYDDIEVVVEVDDHPDWSYLEQEGYEDRLAAFKRGAFDFTGVYATVEVEIAGTIQTIRSPGLWGIESDSERSYYEHVGKEEIDQLVDILDEMNVTVKGAPRR